METDNNSLDGGFTGSAYDSSLETPATGPVPTDPTVPSAGAPESHRPFFKIHKKRLIELGVIVTMIALSVIGGIFLFGSKHSKQLAANNSASTFAAGALSVKGISNTSPLQIGETDHLAVNGQLRVSNTLVLSPTAVPTSPVAGQIYYGKDNQLYFYNGTKFISLGGGSGTPAFNIQNQNGVLYGSATSVSSVVASATGQCLLSTSGAPVFGSCNNNVIGTPGQLAMFTGSGDSVGNSLIGQSGNAISINGSLSLSGVLSGNGSGLTNLNASNVTTGVLQLAVGGTGAVDATDARANLGAAASGTNSDITSLTDLSSITSPGALSIGSAGQTLALQGSSATTLTVANSGFTTTLGFATPTADTSITIPNSNGTVAVQATGPIELDSTGNISCPDCLVSGGGGTMGVVSVNTFSGAVSIIQGTGLNISNNSGTITVAADQDISTTAIPTFNGLVLNGSLGVGTDTPQYPVDVNGDVNSNTGFSINGNPICSSSGCTASGGSNLYIQNSTTLHAANLAIQGNGVGNSVAVIRGATGQTANILAVENSTGTTLLSVGPNGSIGIDTSAPNYPLDVNGDINTNGDLRINGTAVCLTVASVAGCTPNGGSSNYIQNGTTIQTGGTNFAIQSAAAGDIGGVVQGASGQTADLFQAQANGGTEEFGVSAGGNGYFNGGVGIQTTLSGYALNVGGNGEVNAGTGLYVAGVEVCTSSGCLSSGGTGGAVLNGTSLQPSANFAIQSAAAGDIGGVIRGAASQTANLLDLQNSSGVNQFSVGPGGAAYVASSLGVGVTSPSYAVDVVGDLNITGDYRINGVPVCTSGGCSGGGGGGAFINNNTSLQTSANFNISSGATATSPTAIIQAANLQTGDLLDFNTSTGSVAAAVNPSGQLRVAGATAYTTALNVGTNTTTAAGGISFGSDADLYRSGSAALKTDGSLQASELQAAGADFSTGLLLQSTTASSTRSNNLTFTDNQATPQSISLRKQGNNLVVLDNSGNVQLGFSPSTNGILFGSTLDTDLYRSGSDALTTDGALTVVGTFTNHGQAIFQNLTNGTSAFEVQNASGTNLLVGDTNDQRVGIDTTSPPAFTLDVNGDINTSGVYRVNGTPVCTSSGCVVATTSGILNQTTQQTNANFNIQSAGTGDIGAVIGGISGQTADLLDLNDGNGTTVVSVGATGNTLIQPSTNSTTAFQIQNQAGTSNLFVADTTNGKIGINQAPTSTGSALQVTGGVSVTNNFQLLSSAANSGTIEHGAMSGGAVNINDVVVMNSSTQVADTTTARDPRVYGVSGTTVGSSGTYMLVETSGNAIVNATTNSGANPIHIGDQLVTSTTSGDVMADNSATSGIVGTALTALASGNGTVNIAVRPVSGVSNPIFNPQTDSTTAFQIQNAARSTTVLDADTTHTSIGIAGASTSAGYALNVTGTVNASGNIYVNGVAVCSVATCAAGSSSSSFINNGTALQTSANFNIQSTAVGSVTGNLEDLSGQTADLLDFQNSSGTVLAGFTAAGALQGGNGSGTNNGTTSPQTLVFNGGQGTGTGAGGNITFNIAKPGSSGSSLNSESTVATISGANGSLLLQNAVNSTSAFKIENAAGTANTFDVDTFDNRVGVLTSAPNQALTVNAGSENFRLATTPNVIATPSAAGGTLATNTYFYVVTALDGSGAETAITAGTEVSAAVTGPTGSVALSWTGETAALDGYRVYRGTSSGGENVYFSVAAGTTSFTDTGAAGTSGSGVITNNASSTFINGSTAGGSSYFNNGNVGIGTSSPADTLTDAGTALFQGSGNNTTVAGSGTLFENAANSTNAFEIQNQAGTSNLLVADTTDGVIGIGMAPSSTGAALQVAGNINVGGQLVLDSTPLSSNTHLGQIIKNVLNGTGGTSVHDVVVLDSTNHVVDTTTARDSRVYGISVNGGISGTATQVAISGDYTVNATTNSGANPINVGDQLVTSTTTGDVMVDDSATSGILGTALTALASGTGTVDVAINPVRAVSTPIFSPQTDSTTAFEIQNAARSSNLFVADSTDSKIGINTTPTSTGAALQVNGNLSVSSSIILAPSNQTHAGQIVKNVTVAAGGVSANDVVVLNSSAQVADSTTARDPKVYGVSLGTYAGSAVGQMAILGNATVNATAVSTPINIGDQVVVSSTSGDVMSDNSATTGILGTALTALASGTGTVDVAIRPVGGQVNPTFRGSGDNSTVAGSGVLFQNATNSTNAFEIQDQAGTANLLVADTTNDKIGIGAAPTSTGATLQVTNSISASSNITAGTQFILANNNANGGQIQKEAVAGTGGVHVNDVIVMNSSAQVVDTTTARDTRVYGVATNSVASSGNEFVAIGGDYTVNATTNSGANPINIGDQLVTSTTSGDVMSDNSATTGIVGIALSALASGTGTVSIEIRPVGGETNPTFRGSGDSSTVAGSGVLFENAANSTNAFEIQNAAGTSNLFVADTTNGKIGVGAAPSSGGSTLQVTGNVSATSGFFSAAGLSISTAATNAGNITKSATAGTGGVTANDAVVLNSSAQAVDTTTARDPRVYGVATSTAIASATTTVAISGDAIVKAVGPISIGDQLVMSTTSGAVVTDNSATSGILGTALTALASGTSTVNVAIRPVGGVSNPIFSPQSDSTTAFQIQNAARSTTVLDADTTNTSIGIAGASTTAGYALNVTGSVNASTNIYVNGVAVCTVATCAAGSSSSSFINNGTSTQTGNFNIQSASASSVGAVVEGASGQTADLLDLQNANGTILDSINAGGMLNSYDDAAFYAVAAPTGVSAGTPGGSSGTWSSTGTYYWVVTAYNSTGETLQSSTVNKTIAATTQTVGLSWTAVPGAAGYKIYRNTSNSFTSGSLLLTNITNSTTTTYTDTGSATTSGVPPAAPTTGNPLAVYSYSGAASLTVNNYGNTIASNGLQAGGSSGGPAAPGSSSIANALLVTAPAANVGELIRGSSGQTGDLEEFRDSNGNLYSAVSSSGNVTDYGVNDTLDNLAVPSGVSAGAPASGGSLTVSQAYYWVVTAVNAQGETVASSSVTQTPTTGNQTVTISWNIVPGATSFKIYRNTSNSFTSGSLLRSGLTSSNVNCPSTTCSYTDNGGSTSAGLPPTAPTGTGLIVQGWNSQTTPAFQVQSASNANVLAVDTSNTSVGIAGASTTAGFALNVTGTVNATQIDVGGSQIASSNLSDSSNLAKLNGTGPQIFTGNNKFTGSGNSVNAAGSGTLFQNASDSTNAFEIQNAAGTSNLLVADTTNGKIGIGQAPSSSGLTLQVTGGIVSTVEVDAPNRFLLNNSSNSLGNIQKSTIVGTGGVTADDVVILNSSAQAVDTTTARDTRVYGVSNSTATATNNSGIIISGDMVVNATAVSTPINIGDQLVTSTTKGDVMSDNSATSGILGTALTALASGTGTVDVAVRPVSGSSTSTFSPQSDSTTAFQIQNAGRSTTLFDVDSTNSKIGIGAAPTSGGDTLQVTGNISSTTEIDVGANTSLSTTALVIGGNSICTSSGCSASGSGVGGAILNSSSQQTGANFNIQSASTSSVVGVLEGISGQTADLLDLENGSGVKVATVGATGNLLVQPSTNSTTALTVANATGNAEINLNNSATSNLLSYSNFTSGSFSNAATGWAPVSPGTITQNTTAADSYDGRDSLDLTTTSSNGGATTSAFTGTVGAGTYDVSFYVMPSAAMNATGFTITLNDGSNHTCSASSTTLSTTSFVRVSCNTTTSSNLSSVTIAQNDGTGRANIYISDVQMISGAAAGNYQLGTLQLGGSVVTSPVLFQNSVNSSTAFQVQNAAGTSLFTVSTSGSIVTSSVAFSDTGGTLTASGAVAASTGSELVTNTEEFPTGVSGWTSNFTSCPSTCGSSATATHTSGTTAITISPALTITAGSSYQVTFTTGSTTSPGDSITPSIGGTNGSPIFGNDSGEVQTFVATNTGNLTFTPTTGWTGVISAVSVKKITVATSGLTVGGTPFFATNFTNIYEGTNTGSFSSGNNGNVGIGAFSDASITTGGSNVAVGYSSLSAATISNNNTALGYSSLDFATTGHDNTALGYQAGVTNTQGNADVTGSGNTFLGDNSGPGSVTQLQNSTAIGIDSAVTTNNSLVLGCVSGTNSCSTTTNIGIGTTAPANLLSIGALNNTTNTGTSQLAVSIPGTSNSGIVIEESGTPVSGYFFQAQTSAGALLASIDYQGNLSVKAATINGTLTVDGHIITANSSGSTSAAVQTALGSTGTCVLNPTNFAAGNDTSGTIVLTPGGTGITTGVQCIVTFGSAYATWPHVVITPADAASAALGAFGAATATTTFNVGFTTAGTTGVPYTYNYFIAQ